MEPIFKAKIDIQEYENYRGFNIPEFSASVPGQLDDNSFIKNVFNTMSISVNLVSVHHLGKI